jgi:hypothetical protein
MKKIAVYANTCAIGSYKGLWPKAFFDGLQHHKDWASRYVTDRQIVDYEYAWCFAYQVRGDVKASDQSHRRQVIDKYEPSGKIFFLDSDVLISYDGFELDKPTIQSLTKQGLRWTRQPYSSIYANKGAKYFEEQFIENKEKGLERWEDIAYKKKIKVKPYDGKGDHILITCNRGTEGYSAEKKNATEYAIETIQELRQYTKRPIIVRFHRAMSNTQQGDFDRLTNFIKDKKDITIQSKANNNYPDIIPVIQNAYAVCTWSSSSATPAICEGKPLYIKSNNCFFYNMNSGDIKDIENPNIKDIRENWFINYAATHYNLQDLSSGWYFAKVKNLI